MTLTFSRLKVIGTSLRANEREKKNDHKQIDTQMKFLKQLFMSVTGETNFTLRYFFRYQGHYHEVYLAHARTFFTYTPRDTQQQNKTKLTLIIAFDEMRNSVARSATNFVLLAKSSPFSNSLSTVCSARPFFDIKSLHVRRFSNFNDNSEMAAFNSWLGTDNTFLSSSSSSISIARLCDKISRENEKLFTDVYTTNCQRSLITGIEYRQQNSLLFGI